ncbi:hypothetical protein PC114_g15426 [Phytophthora cactorum]|nr:hypothetical protein PC114_g15426 [Phytophthora cactorum]KAG3010302.1 hypothetical protein PC120_g15147 [Phytophthora cactorum]
MPNITTELLAMEAHTIGQWTMADKPMTHHVGDLLKRGTKQLEGNLVPGPCKGTATL